MSLRARYFPLRVTHDIGLDKRLDAFEERACVAVRAAAPLFFVSRGRVFANPLLGVVNSHNDERLDRALDDQLIGRLAHSPVHAGYK